jgi:hypothetical protein
MNNKLFSLLLSVSALLTLIAVAGKAKAEFYSCTPIEVGEISDGPNSRIHVVCSNPWLMHNPTTNHDDNIRYIAVSSIDFRAQRFLSLATSALLANKTFRVDIPTSSWTNVAGCGQTDCRTPTYFGLVP